MTSSRLIAKLYLVFLSVFLALPLIFTFLYSLFSDFTGLLPKGFTLAAYHELFLGSESILPVLLRTLAIGILPTCILTVILAFTFYGLLIYFPRADRWIEPLTKIPYGIQGVILAVSLIGLYGNSDTILSNRILLLGTAYAVVILPFLYQGMKNAFLSIELMPILEAAEILGASRLYAYIRLILPAISKGILATMLLCMGILFCDFVLVNILAGSYYETLGIYLNLVRARSGAMASAVSSLMFLIMMILSLTVNHILLKKQPKERDSMKS